MSDDLPFQLIAWIKREQEEMLLHRERMAIRRFAEDSEFMEYVGVLASNWGILSLREKLMLSGIAKHRKSGKCLTTAQRSAVVAVYLKHAY
jgi:hypothetical protein